MRKFLVPLGVTLFSLGSLLGVVLLRKEHAPLRAPVATESAPAQAPRPASPASGMPPAAVPALVERAGELESRLSKLLSRREELVRHNEALRRKIADTRLEQNIKKIAPSFVSGLIKRMDGATDAQRVLLIDMRVAWETEDQGCGAGGPWWRDLDERRIRQRLLERESELRAVLTAEQQAKLQAVAQDRLFVFWQSVARDTAVKLGQGLLEASPETRALSIDQVRSVLAQAPTAPSSTMILSGAYGMDLWSLEQVALERLGVQAPADGAGRTEGSTLDTARKRIAGSWHLDLQ
jgi:hypothetical protein